MVESDIIQRDLNKISKWTKDWLLTLNVEKCTVLHIGRNNTKKKYYLDTTQLQPVNRQKDLGIIINYDLKWEEHIINIVKKANSLLYIVRKSFHSITPQLFLTVYKTYIRPILEFGFQIWNPYFEKDINMLEKVQRRATKLPMGFKKLEYEERLQRLKLLTLRQRRERGDLIETYKILNNYYNAGELKSFFKIKIREQSRRHNMQLEKSVAKTLPKQHILFNRVVTAWNGLPETVINAKNVNQFKNRLDSYLRLL